MGFRSFISVLGCQPFDKVKKNMHVVFLTRRWDGNMWDHLLELAYKNNQLYPLKFIEKPVRGSKLIDCQVDFVNCSFA